MVDQRRKQQAEAKRQSNRLKQKSVPTASRSPSCTAGPDPLDLLTSADNQSTSTLDQRQSTPLDMTPPPSLTEEEKEAVRDKIQARLASGEDILSPSPSLSPSDKRKLADSDVEHENSSSSDDEDEDPVPPSPLRQEHPSHKDSAPPKKKKKTDQVVRKTDVVVLSDEEQEVALPPIKLRFNIPVDGAMEQFTTKAQDGYSAFLNSLTKTLHVKQSKLPSVQYRLSSSGIRSVPVRLSTEEHFSHLAQSTHRSLKSKSQKPGYGNDTVINLLFSNDKNSSKNKQDKDQKRQKIIKISKKGKKASKAAAVEDSSDAKSKSSDSSETESETEKTVSGPEHIEVIKRKLRCGQHPGRACVRNSTGHHTLTAAQLSSWGVYNVAGYESHSRPPDQLKLGEKASATTAPALEPPTDNTPQQQLLTAVLSLAATAITNNQKINSSEPIPLANHINAHDEHDSDDEEYDTGYFPTIQTFLLDEDQKLLKTIAPSETDPPPVGKFSRWADALTELGFERVIDLEDEKMVTADGLVSKCPGLQWGVAVSILTKARRLCKRIKVQIKAAAKQPRRYN